MQNLTYIYALIRYMLAKGARLDLHSENGQGPRPIHWASRNGHVAVVDILLSVSNFLWKELDIFTYICILHLIAYNI